MKIHFIPGLAANCKCFKFIELPHGFEKIYIEWLHPEPQETLEHYTLRMAENIDPSDPFMLLGYSFGGVIVQEMNRFLSPEKTILLSSIKNNVQRPKYFDWVQKTHLTHWFPMNFFANDGFLSYTFARSVYFGKHMEKFEEYLSLHTDPIYMRWAIDNVTKWKSTVLCENLYQIHGTKDIVFPYKLIKKNNDKNIENQLFTIPGGDHLMALLKPHLINQALKEILEK
ncbi:MAG: alpha/beta hydrolase [Flavobacteriaceae bacterium]|jgi:hypothetical protein|nr:alpha/beta hydrolase [Flavobacteriaceae bacterium]